MKRLVLLVAPLAALAGLLNADCGSVPFRAPDATLFTVQSSGQPAPAAQPPGTSNKVLAAQPEVTFDPLKVSVFEPHQRALIAWNGKEEVLLLSTDQRATQDSAILEVIPLPGEPKVRLGDFETFERAQRLVVRKETWAVAHGGPDGGNVALPESAGRITFEEKLGAHDLVVAEVRNSAEFALFVEKHLKEKYGATTAIRPEFLNIIQDYAEGGTRWFAFDRIDLTSGHANSRQPIEYRFPSPSVYYPLKISRLEKGETHVDLLVFSESGLNTFEGLPRSSFKISPTLPASVQEILDVEPAWKGFFSEAKDIKVDRWNLVGETTAFQKDVLVRP